MRFIKDTIYDLYQYLLMILILLLVSWVLITTVRKMYTTDYNKLSSQETDRLSITQAIEKDEPTVFELIFPESFGLLDTSKVLVDSQVITDEEAFVAYIQENSLEEVIQPGTYHFVRNMSFEEVLEAFQNAQLAGDAGESEN